MNLKRLSPAVLLLSLAACATPSPSSFELPPIDVDGAEIATRTADNGDTIEEYRVGMQLRMVKITPLRGAVYYLYDRNGDGKLDSDSKQMPATYWKLFGW